MIRELLIAGAALAQVASFASAQGLPPYNALKFDLNGFTGMFYDAAGGSNGVGSILPTLDPGGASAANGATPFTGSIEFSPGGGLISVGDVVGNDSANLFGPWANAGNGGAFALAGGFLDFQSGWSAGGEIHFSNSAGDELVASFDPSHSGPLSFGFGFYDVLAHFDSASFQDARGDGLFGEPGTGVDITEFSGISANGFLMIPLMTATGQTIDWDVVVAIPSPAGAIVLGAGLMFSGRRRRN